jgi:hypothetical protein
MRLVVELDTTEFEDAVANGFADAPVETVELRQRDGLLRHELKCRYVEPVGPLVAFHRGLGDGPHLRAWFGEKELRDVSD